LTAKVDEVEKVKDEKADEPVKASPETSPKTDKQSLQKPEFSKEQEKEVQDRVSAILAKKGDEAVILRSEVDTLKAAEKTRQDALLENAATQVGKTVDELAKAGYDTADKVIAAANLFGSGEKPITATPIPDSGKTLGGSVSDQDFVKKLGEGSGPLSKEERARYQKTLK